MVFAILVRRHLYIESRPGFFFQWPIFVVNTQELTNNVAWLVCRNGANRCSTLNTTRMSPRWRHQMKKFSALLVLCEGNPPVNGGFQWRRALVFSLICAWTNGRANNRDAGDLTRHRAHYDVTVMTLLIVVSRWGLHKMADMLQRHVQMYFL